jgi:hypothetical protein
METFDPMRDEAFLESVFGAASWRDHLRRIPDPTAPPVLDRKGASSPGYKARYQSDKHEPLLTLYVAYALFRDERRQVEHLGALLTAAGLENPGPLGSVKRIRLEYEVSTPKAYDERLRESILRHPIGYTRERAVNHRRSLEGPTHLDLYIETDHRVVFFEAKFLSDISYLTDYAIARNQLARVIDVSLGNTRSSRAGNVVLVTPARFKAKGPDAWSRLYAYKYRDYKTDPRTLMKDLPHRLGEEEDVKQAVENLGWVSWEDLAEIARRTQAKDAFWAATAWETFERFLDHRGLGRAVA